MLLVAPAWDLTWLLMSAAHQAPALLLSPHPGWDSLFFLLSGHSIQSASCWIAENPCPVSRHPSAPSPLRQLCLQSASPNTFPQKTRLPSLSPTFIQELTYLSLPYSHMVSTWREAVATLPAAAGPIPGLCSPGPFCPTPTSKRPRYFPGQELFAFLDYYLSLQNFFRVLNGIFIVVTACLFFWNVFKCLKLAYEMQRI